MKRSAALFVTWPLTGEWWNSPETVLLITQRLPLFYELCSNCRSAWAEKYFRVTKPDSLTLGQSDPVVNPGRMTEKICLRHSAYAPNLIPQICLFPSLITSTFTPTFYKRHPWSSLFPFQHWLVTLTMSAWMSGMKCNSQVWHFNPPLCRSRAQITSMNRKKVDWRERRKKKQNKVKEV